MVLIVVNQNPIIINLVMLYINHISDNKTELRDETTKIRLNFSSRAGAS